MEEETIYIEYATNGNLIAQDPINKRHMFINRPALDPESKEKVPLKFRSLEAALEYLRDNYRFGGWINNAS